MSSSRRVLLALVLASPLFVACASPGPEDEGSARQDINAAQANDQQHQIRLVLENVRGGRAAERLGIARWDVYAGKSGKGFEGAVFYASDADGDVKVFFAFDNATKTYAVGQLDKEGRSVDTPIDRATLDALFVDIAMLRDQARREAAKDCAAGIGLAALSAVVVAGAAAFVGVPTAVGTAVVGTAQVATAGELVAVAALFVGVKGVVTAVIGVAAGAAVAAVSGTVSSCGMAAGGVAGEPSPRTN